MRVNFLQKKEMEVNEEYTCDMCKETFGKGRSDEEAIAEHTELFGTEDISDCAIVCDDCFNKLNERYDFENKEPEIPLVVKLNFSHQKDTNE